MKKNFNYIFLLGMFTVSLGLNGCSSSASASTRLQKKNVVENALNEQMSKEESSNKKESSNKESSSSESVSSETSNTETSNTETSNAETSNTETTNTESASSTEYVDPVKEAMNNIESSQAMESIKARENADELMKSTAGVDYDLTKLGSDMVYASVYQLMMEPENFEGKVFKIKGIYYSSFFDKTNKQYQYCIIQDALACCSQGIEFIWGNGEHAYPDEYPAEGSLVEITGTFQTYKEDGDDRLYCRLNNCDMKVLGNPETTGN